MKALLSVALKRVGSVAACDASVETEFVFIFICDYDSKRRRKKSAQIDMPSFLKEKPFNPSVSSVPVLGSSSGNPDSFKDPKSVASIGNNIQAMADQASADTLYDAPPPKREGFANSAAPWIVNSRACKREAFTDYSGPDALTVVLGLMVAVAVGLILCSIQSSRNVRAR
jgi:hypothetical protein